MDANTMTRVVGNKRIPCIVIDKETGERSQRHPVDAREMVAMGRYEYALDVQPIPVPEIKVDVNGTSSALGTNGGSGTIMIATTAKTPKARSASELFRTRLMSEPAPLGTGRARGAAAVAIARPSVRAAVDREAIIPITNAVP
jgi:hypothetical protein